MGDRYLGFCNSMAGIGDRWDSRTDDPWWESVTDSRIDDPWRESVIDRRTDDPWRD